MSFPILDPERDTSLVVTNFETGICFENTDRRRTAKGLSPDTSVSLSKTLSLSLALSQPISKALLLQPFGLRSASNLLGSAAACATAVDQSDDDAYSSDSLFKFSFERRGSCSVASSTRGRCLFQSRPIQPPWIPAGPRGCIAGGLRVT